MDELTIRMNDWMNGGQGLDVHMNRALVDRQLR